MLFDTTPLPELAQLAECCTACPLFRDATRTVFGEGPTDARLMLVGEAPGDQEDKAGRPFVGPAGRLLGQALEEAGIERERVYLTNAVKHFKFLRKGSFRLHQKPALAEINACNPWLGQEIAALNPTLIVALGATGGRALLGRDVTISKLRGPIEWRGGHRGFLTVHPSYLLRIPEEHAKATAYGEFVADLRRVKSLVEGAVGRA